MKNWNLVLAGALLVSQASAMADHNSSRTRPINIEQDCRRVATCTLQAECTDLGDEDSFSVSSADLRERSELTASAFMIKKFRDTLECVMDDGQIWTFKNDRSGDMPSFADYKIVSGHYRYVKDVPADTRDEVLGLAHQKCEKKRALLLKLVPACAN